MNFRLEREKGSLANELTNSKTESDKLKMEKAVLERDSKNAHYKLNEVQLRLDEASRNLSDLESLRNKLVGENGELERKMDEAFSQVSQLNKIKVIMSLIMSGMLMTVLVILGKLRDSTCRFPKECRRRGTGETSITV